MKISNEILKFLIKKFDLDYNLIEYKITSLSSIVLIFGMKFWDSSNENVIADSKVKV